MTNDDSKPTPQSSSSRSPEEPAQRTQAPPQPPVSEPAGTAPAADDIAAFPVVGIGASSGGLTALKRLLAAMPNDLGVAFVVVAHSSPDHESHPAELLGPVSTLPVKQVTETMAIAPDHVYVIPPDAQLESIDTHLRLAPLQRSAGRRTTIDHLFGTLAATHADKELQSANEELRSTMEELETSKEELQSINEELQTVNQEHRHKVSELSELSSDLQNLMVASGIATLFLDRELRIMRFTPKIAELFSIRLTDRGRPLADLTHRLGGADLPEVARTVLRDMAPVEHEMEADSGRWFLTRVMPYRAIDDRIAGVVLTFVDITDAKRTELELRSLKELSESIIEALPEPLMVLAADGTVRAVNRVFQEHFPDLPPNPVGHKLRELGAPWDLPALEELLTETLPLRGAFDEFQIDHVFDSIGPRTLLVSGRLVERGGLILLALRDVTERFAAARALRESRAQLGADLAGMQRLHQLVARLLVTPDIESALDEVLVAAMEITGAATGSVQLLDQQSDSLHTVAARGMTPGAGSDSDVVWAQTLWVGSRLVVEDALAEGVPPAIRALAEAGGYRGVQATPLCNREGAPLGVLATLYREAFRPSERNLRLLDLYARQAADFIERQQSMSRLRASEARLSDENRDKDEYIAMLGHELRNPLSAITNALDLIALTGAPMDERVVHACGVIDRQGRYMARIVQDILAASRIARGKLVLELAPLDLHAVLEQVVHDHGALVTERGLEFRSAIGSEPAYVMGDETRLIQVVDNLIGNAVKFTDPPGAISLTLERQPDALLVRVRDTGVGVRPESLSSIFEAFKQETDGPARPRGGLGLGLALAKGIVSMHAGRIWASSDGPGAGTEVVFSLSRTDRRPEARTAPVEGGTRPIQVLIVEDEPDVAQTLRISLTARGHGVTAVTNGPEALEVLGTQTIDLVLCDLGLSGMNGYELARTIRDGEGLGTPMLVALTGYGREEDRRRALEFGFHEHVTKPMAPETLIRIVARAGHRS